MINQKCLNLKSGNAVVVLEANFTTLGKKKIPTYTVKRIDTGTEMISDRRGIIPFSDLEKVMDPEDAEALRNKYGN